MPLPAHMDATLDRLMGTGAPGRAAAVGPRSFSHLAPSAGASPLGSPEYDVRARPVDPRWDLPAEVVERIRKAARSRGLTPEQLVEELLRAAPSLPAPIPANPQRWNPGEETPRGTVPSALAAHLLARLPPASASPLRPADLTPGRMMRVLADMRARSVQ